MNTKTEQQRMLQAAHAAYRQAHQIWNSECHTIVPDGNGHAQIVKGPITKKNVHPDLRSASVTLGLNSFETERFCYVQCTLSASEVRAVQECIDRGEPFYDTNPAAVEKDLACFEWELATFSSHIPLFTPSRRKVIERLKTAVAMTKEVFDKVQVDN